MAAAQIRRDDVTERRRLERVRQDFVANASHELRTPLTSIRGFVEALGAAAALVAVVRYKVGIIPLIGVAAATGLVLRLTGIA